MPVPVFKAKSVTSLIELRAHENPDDPAIHTGAAEFGDDLKTLTYKQIARAVDRLAAFYLPLVRTPSEPSSSSSSSPPEQVIAVLVSTAIDETLLQIALSKLGLAPFLLSVNNSPLAVAHLVKVTNATHLIHSQKFFEAATIAQDELSSQGISVELVEDRRFPLWGPGGIDDVKIAKFPPRFTPDVEASRTGVILHSSGSTGFPKPVYISHFGLIANLHNAMAVPAYSSLPCYHGFGFYSIFRCIYHAQPLTLIPPHLPLTSANICRVIKESPSPPRQHFAVSYVLKLLAETAEGIEVLAGHEAVSFAGAAVPDDLGDRLVAAGVNLVSYWGLTETGAVLNSKRDFTKDKGWNWLRCEGLAAQYVVAEPRGGDTYELVVLDGYPPKIMSNRDDGSYATKDLFVRHPTERTWYKYIGRLDDTLTQTLGEKTNPVPIELAIRGNSALVQECIVFGDARPQIGCLLLPSETAGDLWKDRSAYLATIRPVIEDINQRSPTHSRILPEMVGILPPGTEIPVATKMTILRPACYKKFAAEIDSLYSAFENGNGQAKRVIEEQEEMEIFLKQTIMSALGAGRKGETLDADTDLFAYGVDSLQATRVRNVIQKSIELNGRKLGQNILFENQTVRALAQYLLGLIAGSDQSKSTAQQHQVMLDMVDKWSSRLITNREPFVTSATPANGEVVVLTGATGSLGAHILDCLMRCPAVRKVICLSRAKSHEESLRRVQASLRERMRPAADEAKLVSFAADVNEENLDLTPAEYELLRSEACVVVHNAWPVNFVLSTESFDEHVGGAVNLLNLTLKSPYQKAPPFYFSSSVGTRQGRFEATVTEDFSDSPETAGSMGYARSKWVVEKLLQRAGTTTDATVGVLRIGQLVGDTENGVWNETEAWPLMFKSIDTVGALPMLRETLSWLPVNLAGKAIVEIVTSSTKPKSGAVYHVVNPNVTGTWEDVINGLERAGKKFDRVDRFEWLDRLSRSDSDVAKNPTYKLLTFYTNRMGNKGERSTMDFAVEQTARIAPTIGECPPLSATLASLWMQHWRKTGFLA